MEFIQSKRNVAMLLKKFYKRKFFYNTMGLNNRKKNFIVKKKHSIKMQKSLEQLEEKNNKLYSFHNFYAGIKTYKHYRNVVGYPARGQRTHTNARTKKKYKIKINS